MEHYSEPIARLIEAFSRLPGVGRKTAQRFAFHVINMSEEEVKALSEAILSVKENLTYCSICCNLSDQSICSICTSPSRSEEVICVVEDPRDVAAMERTREFNGRYHVLHGTISPMDSITPDMLRIKELLHRMASENVKEVIMATNPTIDGEATAMYIARLLKPFGVKVTRIAHGLPVGADIEYADEMTISKALENRRVIL